MPRYRHQCTSATKPNRTFYVDGKPYYEIDRIDVRRRTYVLLDRLSSSTRKRYLAFDPYAGPRGQPVAVVILPRSEASRQHLAVLQKLSEASDAFPTILDYGVQSDETIVVLKWISGSTLAQYLHDVCDGRTPRISPVVAWQRVGALAHGLRRRLGRQQIVHGDIKPENLILARDPGRLVLIDFGSAWKVSDTSRRVAGDGISPLYSAPELQSRGAYVDFRCDQFSLSMVLYQLLTLQIPYGHLGGQAGRPALPTAQAVRLKPPSSLCASYHKLPSYIWPQIDSVVTRGLALDPAERYPTPEAWLDALDAVQLELDCPRKISPLNEQLTRVVTWVADRLTGTRQ